MADTLKSFLVSIGFTIDTDSQKKAEDKVKQTEVKNTATTKTESAKREKLDKDQDAAREKRLKEEEKRANDRTERAKKMLGGVASVAMKTEVAITAISAAATGVVFAVDRASQAFERLNYSARRAGTSAAGITAFGYASSQLGSTAEAGQEQLGGFGQRLMAPGFRQALQRLLGKSITDRSGNLTESTEELATDLGARLRRMRAEGQNGYQRALAFGERYGFDENQTRAMMDPRFAGFEADRRAQMGRLGANPDAAAQAGTAFEQSMRHFTSVVDDISTKIATELTTRLQPQLDKLSDWVAAHEVEIEKVTDQLSSIVEYVATSKRLWETLEKIEQGFSTISKYLGEDDLPKYIENSVKEFDRLQTALGNFTDWIERKLRSLGLIASPTTPAEPGGLVVPQHDYDGGGGAPRGSGAIRHSARQGLGTRLGMEPAAPFAADEFKKETGASDDEYAAMKDGISQLEGAKYGQMGGSSGRFAGRYQMGQEEINETARSLGETPPSRADFLSNPEMQERYFQRYTLRHYRQLMQDKAFSSLPLRKRLEILGYAHNQGVGGALKFLHSGQAGSDAFGTPGTAYSDSIHRRLSKVLQPSPFAEEQRKARALIQKGLQAGHGSDDAPKGVHGGMANPYGTLDRGSFSTRGDTNVTHNPTYNITGPDLAAAMSAARLQASRGLQDTLRNTQGAEQ